MLGNPAQKSISSWARPALDLQIRPINRKEEVFSFANLGGLAYGRDLKAPQGSTSLGSIRPQRSPLGLTASLGRDGAATARCDTRKLLTQLVLSTREPFLHTPPGGGEGGEGCTALFLSKMKAGSC